ncbi:MBL fold metallo-hydrolase [Methanotorris igneus]|uniref:UPF0282 protein Metig_1391 n=1 Tax=Methanotorris igneus (strain DSM 5666 / JCM 11834 / Kol 5) TaxID=880724 RepID=F6BF56_METIK|nr:MBL fold metallo-hydrolase [Methanotorris igneus]AEF96926.1 UPF0282 protein [Methanotorris igneus Kol 5]
MKIIPIASESLGVRSLATYVETEDVKVLIDPGVAIAPKRYGLPPNEIEFEQLRKIREKLNNFAKECDIITISHYHYDHYTPFHDDEYLDSKDYAKTLYKDKILLIKHPTEFINRSQMKRAKVFLENVKNIAKEINYADNKTFRFKNTQIKFSPPFPHGKDAKLGYVLLTTIKDKNFTFLHASDVQGVIFDELKDYIINECPDLIIMSGPPTYLINRFGKENLKKVDENLIDILKNTDAQLILDHHFLRDKNYKEKLSVDFKTIAEYIGEENYLLEAYRKDIKDGKQINFKP